MALDKKRFSYDYDHILRDSRSIFVRLADWLEKKDNAAMVYGSFIALIIFLPHTLYFLDFLLLAGLYFYYWLMGRSRALPYKMPMTANRKYKDKQNTGGSRSGKSEGILYLGNKDKSGEEVWFTNADARTHILYLGTTGAGKTEGLKSMATNALCWASGFVYIDGKADTDLWSSLSSLVRRFGRDDDLFVLNYMTGNSDVRAPSNTMNPFSSGSASYLTQMLVSLMPEAEGDNAMWKERAVSLIGSVMPVLTWKRDHQDIPLSISTIRKYLELGPIIRLSRDEAVPEKLRESLQGYLNTLPGYVDGAFDDDGNEKPPGPDTPMVDTQVVRQQHGYLSMQFTRALQSLGDDYGYIFDTQAADVDMIDIVLNRRVLVVLIPALEKSADETANLGKIVAATIKGMMGSTLGATVEGEVSKTIENKPTQSSTPFMTIFDEVGYYTASGMAVMAAQARSLGFCLVYAAQDLPALEKRVKEEARSITGNCNIKIFGKLEDPTQTKEFFENTVGQSLVTQVSSFQVDSGSFTGSYNDQMSAGVERRSNASYDALKGFSEGQACIAFGETVEDVNMFYCALDQAKAMRVQKFLALAPPDEAFLKQVTNLTKLRDRMVSKTWTAAKADVSHEEVPELEALEEGFLLAREHKKDMIEAGSMALVHTHVKGNNIDLDDIGGKTKPADKDSKDHDKKDKKDKVPEPVGTAAGPDGAKEQTSAEKGPNWSQLLGDEEEEQKKNETEEDEDEGKSGSRDSRGLKKVSGEYSTDDAVDAYAKDGEYQLPEGLSDEVMDILMGAADNIRSGLFGDPEVAQKAEQKSGMPKDKNIKPKGR